MAGAAGFEHPHSELRSEVLRRYQNVADGPGRNLIERVVAELGDADDVLAMVRAYARSARRFDGLLDKAIRDAALSQRPAIGWAGAYALHLVAVAALRKELFGMAARWRARRSFGRGLSDSH